MIRALAIAAVVAAGCTAADERPATWAFLHPAVIAPQCATPACHGDLAARGGIVLDDADLAYARLRDDRWVVPGDPTSALLYLLEAEERIRMPPDAPLPAADVALVRAWIEEGAPR